MKITFATTQIETVCRDPKRAAQKLGDLSAKKLRLRLTELFNAETVSELVAGHPHPLRGDRQGEFAVDLYGGDRLVFRSSHQPPLLDTNGSVDWGRVTAITIIELGDYHA